ncbi:MAG: hypothetical protein V3T83_08925 [Acidobacteriota bacterium]
MGQKVTTAFQLYCSTGRDEDAGIFFSHCPSLDISSQGQDVKEANGALLEAIGLTIKHWYKLGKLDNFLSKKGFTRRAVSNRPPSTRGRDEFVMIHDDTDYLFSIPSAFLTHTSTIIPD